jgi:hypothetical protein
MNVKTKGDSKQWMHTHTPDRSRKMKLMPSGKLMTAVFWDKKGVTDLIIHATRDHSNIRSVLHGNSE